jgi:hypothetical protein
MRLALPPLLVAMFLCALPQARGDDFTADLPVVREFLDLDTSYSPQERAAAEAAFARLEQSAGNMAAAAFQLAVAHIAALARNGHTMLLAGVWQHQFNRTPLAYHAFADGVFVVQAPEPMRELLGVRLTAIDGRDVDALADAFTTYCGARRSKCDEWLGFFLESPAILHAAGFAKADDRVDVQLALADNSKTTRTLVAALDPPEGEIFAFLDESRLVTFVAENVVPQDGVPFYLTSPGQAFLGTVLEELDAIYLQLRINKSYYDQRIEDFFAQARAQLKAATPRHVIVDLRLDGGGDLNTTRQFFQSLPSLVPGDGRIFGLTSGRTFSAGIASAGYLKQAAPERVTIVGEPIGDDLEFWAEGGFVQLPVSRAVLLPATERHDYVTGCQEADCHESIRRHPIRVQSLEPDIAAPLSYADYRAGRDAALEAVRRALAE